MGDTKESLIAAVTAKGDEVRAAKANKMPKEEMMALVEQLKGLKAKYEQVTGEPYPAPASARSSKKKKKDTGDQGQKQEKKQKQKQKQKPAAEPAAAGAPKIQGQDALFAELKKHGIAPNACLQHDAVITVEDMMAKAGGLAGGRAKNLFLKDKKKNMYLLSALHDTNTPTKALEQKYGIKSGTLRLVHDADLLMSTLGVVQGAVSPFCAANDVAGKVKVVLDAHFQAFDSLCFHPLVNTATMSVATADLVKFLEACGHEPEFVDFGAPLGAESQAFKDAPPPASSAAAAEAGSARESRLSKLSEEPEPVLTVPLAALDSVMPEDGGFYVCVGVAVWVADADGATAWAGVVKSAPGDELGVWGVQRLSDESMQAVGWQSMWPRRVFTPLVAEPEASGPLGVKLIPPADGKGAAEGGRWTVRIQGKGAALAEPEEEEEAPPDRVPAKLVLPESPQLAGTQPAVPPFGDGGDRVARCADVLSELGLAYEPRKHEPCVASEGKTSNQHHHEVLPVDGHIVVTLLLKGQKKKELILLVKKPSTKLNLKDFGKSAEVSVVGKAVRMADPKALAASLGLAPDFVSPLALVNALDGGTVLHRVIFDAALQDGRKLWCLPPMVNDESCARQPRPFCPSAK